MEPLTPPPPLAEPAVRIDSHLEGADERSLADDVLDGLTRPFKELPPKHFYDERGAELFDRICELPEYYPTRAERAILQEQARELARLTGAPERWRRPGRCGSGPAAPSGDIRGSAHIPTASTRRSSSATPTACCAAARGRPPRGWPA